MAGDIKSGIGLGLFLAAVYGAIAVAVFVVSGGRAFTELGVPLPLVLVGYAVCGFVSGAVYGLLSRLGDSWWGTALLGFLVALPSSLVLMFLVVPRSGWRYVPISSLIFAAIFGPITGLLIRANNRLS